MTKKKQMVTIDQTIAAPNHETKILSETSSKFETHFMKI